MQILRDSANEQGGILGFVQLFSGGALTQFAVFALGIMPYITASIIMQVLGVVIPKLEELQQQGKGGGPAVVRVGELFRHALRANCAGMIVVHNHPSGDPTPSKEDHDITARLAEAGRILGIPLLDHVVVGADGYTSFKTPVESPNSVTSSMPSVSNILKYRFASGTL